jgi:hypothetical protein
MATSALRTCAARNGGRIRAPRFTALRSRPSRAAVRVPGLRRQHGGGPARTSGWTRPGYGCWSWGRPPRHARAPLPVASANSWRAPRRCGRGTGSRKDFLAALQAHGTPMSRTEISAALGRHASGNEITRARIAVGGREGAVPLGSDGRAPGREMGGRAMSRLVRPDAGLTRDAREGSERRGMPRPSSASLACGAAQSAAVASDGATSASCTTGHTSLVQDKRSSLLSHWWSAHPRRAIQAAGAAEKPFSFPAAPNGGSRPKRNPVRGGAVLPSADSPERVRMDRTQRRAAAAHLGAAIQRSLDPALFVQAVRDGWRGANLAVEPSC